MNTFPSSGFKDQPSPPHPVGRGAPSSQHRCDCRLPRALRAGLGETDEPVASSTPEVSGIAESRSLIQEGKYDEALAILRPLARGREVDAGVLFQIGLAATGASQQSGLADDQRRALLDEAIGAFRTMLIDRPGLVRVRLELALALFLKGENDLSRRHFEHVLAGNPPAPTARQST